MRADLAQRIAAGCVVVTPNRRLAAYLERKYDAHQLAAGKKAWPSAECLHLDAFLERAYGELTRLEPAAVLLAEPQENALWEQVVTGSPWGAGLLQPEAAARSARLAWRICNSYRIELEPLHAALDEDCRAFLGWSQRYRELLRERGWLDAARLPDAVALALEAGAAPAPRPLVLYGFDRITTQQRAAFDALARHGWRVSEMSVAPRAGATSRRCGYDDREAELAAVAHRAREILAARPDAAIGVVVPDLAAARSEVLRIFDDVLEPARALGGARERARPYNVSLGPPLSAEPLVHTAFLILELARGELPLEEAGSLLRSPFLAAAERELAPRALLDRALREEGRPRVSLQRLARHALGDAAGGPARCPELAERLGRWTRLAAAARGGRRAPSQWSAEFLRLLSGIGWPGERTLDSEEYQAFVAWRETVASLGALDPVTPRLAYGEALARLRRLAAETVFQPRMPEVPVQVLGVLEANGLEFDHLFVTGLSDEAWPPPPHPNPYLPLALQRAHGVAHATGEWQLEYARRAVAAWMGAAPEVQFSWPRREGERALGMSPLLGPLAEVPAPAGAPAGLREAIFAARALEEIADFAAPALPAGIEVKGGAEFFQEQAACPFRGFARCRLGASALEGARVGLDGRERGTLVHRAAEHLWRELASSERLAAIGAGELAAAAGRAAAAAVESMRRRRPDVLSEAFAALERERLAGLLLRLAVLEKARAPFVVLGREERRPVAVAGVKVETRLDRVDRLGDGSQVVLDYKTSREVGVDSWMGERPDEPQLPLYAASARGELAAVAFVQLNARQVRFEGLARSRDLLPQVPAIGESKVADRCGGWRDLIENWRAVLEALAREYLAGRADVAPKKYPETCRNCDFPTLCRVRELEGAGGTAEDGA